MDADGLLHHVGFTSSIAAGDRAALTKKTGIADRPARIYRSLTCGPSRWNHGKASEWQSLKTKLVVEVS
jgi:hypothetical protein